jgi:hypothetical protein
MEQDPLTIEMNVLKHAEGVYRARLANEPDDSGARIKLAWCLFMRALYRAGQESMLNALVSGEEEAHRARRRIKGVWDQDADDLIRDCVSQTGIVLHLSSDPKFQSDAQRLQTLVKMSGGETAVAHAREHSSRTLSEMLQEIL